MDILKAHITTLERDQLSAHQSELTAFFMNALDFRAEHSEVGVGGSLGNRPEYISHFQDQSILLSIKLSKETEESIET